MDIYFLRHASAGEANLNPTKDEKRPLDKLGIEQSHDVGRALAALNVTVDAVIFWPWFNRFQARQRWRRWQFDPRSRWPRFGLT